MRARRRAAGGAHRWIGVALATYLALTACGLGPVAVDGPPDRTTAAVIEARCPRSASGLGLPTAGTDEGPLPGAVPTDFVATTVLRCRQDGEDLRPDGTRRIAIVEETAAVTPDLLEALGRPGRAVVRQLGSFTVGTV